MAHYLSVAEARALPGLRLVLTRGVPGPWGETAKAIFHAKGIPFVKVAQDAGGENAELVDWTGHANAPTAVYGNEPPRAGREEILHLAERLAPDPPLLPADPLERARVRGLCEEIAGADGFGWNRRLMLLAPMHAAQQVPGSVAGIRDRLSRRYGYTQASAERAPRRSAEVLRLLSRRIESQRDAGSPYFFGHQLSVADLTWAAFAALARPLPDDVCAMPAGMRAGYEVRDPTVLEALAPILLEHRDFIYERHLELPLDL